MAVLGYLPTLLPSPQVQDYKFYKEKFMMDISEYTLPIDTPPP